MTQDMINRYAVSLYVDLRLGLVGGDKIHTTDEAHSKVAKVYGKDAAAYAERIAN